MYTNDLEQMFGFLYSKAEAFHIQKKEPILQLLHFVDPN